MRADKKPNELDKQPYFLRDTDDLRQKLNIELRDLEQMAREGYIQTSDGQDINHLIAARKQFLSRIEPSAGSSKPRW